MEVNKGGRGRDEAARVRKVGVGHPCIFYASYEVEALWRDSGRGVELSANEQRWRAHLPGGLATTEIDLALGATRG